MPLFDPHPDIHKVAPGENLRAPTGHHQQPIIGDELNTSS
jgi:hypothetical protein